MERNDSLSPLTLILSPSRGRGWGEGVVRVRGAH